MKTKILTIIGIAVCVVALLPGYSMAAGRASLSLEVILASNQATGIDPQIQCDIGQLRSVFAFDGYRSISKHGVSLDVGQVMDLRIAGNKNLTLRLNGRDKHTVNLNVRITSGRGRLVLNTDFQLAVRSTILVGGIRTPEGILIVAIRAES